MKNFSTTKFFREILWRKIFCLENFDPWNFHAKKFQGRKISYKQKFLSLPEIFMAEGKFQWERRNFPALPSWRPLWGAGKCLHSLKFSTVGSKSWLARNFLKKLWPFFRRNFLQSRFSIRRDRLVSSSETIHLILRTKRAWLQHLSQLMPVYCYC